MKKIELKLKLQKDNRDGNINLTITKQAGVCNPCRRKNQDNSPKDIYLINQAVNLLSEKSNHSKPTKSFKSKVPVKFLL